MLRLYCKAKALWATRDRGATAAEYALLIAFIAGILVVVVAGFRGTLQSLFNTTCNALDGGGNGCAP
jgi:pilus assembly protein Flp/PilA